MRVLLSFSSLCLMVAMSMPAAALAAASDTITVVTLNLWHDQHDWPRRMERIVRELRALSPDVICLQEVLQHERLPNQAITLAERLGCSAHFVSVDGQERPKRYGNAVLTSHHVLHAGGKFLLPLDDYRVVAHVRVDLRGRAVDVYDTHLHHTPQGGAIRAMQARDLLAFVDSTRGTGPLVLAGDFNAELGSPEMRPIEDVCLDAWATLHPGADRDEAATMNPALGNAPVAIDHVFVPRSGAQGLKPVAAEVLFRALDADSVWASDHFGVVARFVLPPAARRQRARPLERREEAGRR